MRLSLKFLLLLSVAPPWYGLDTDPYANKSVLIRRTLPQLLSYDNGIGCENSKGLFSMIHFRNSSSGIQSLFFRMDKTSIARVTENSVLWSAECIIEIMNRNASWPFICEAEIRILNMSGFTIVLKKSIGNGCSVVHISGGGSVILNSMNISGGSMNYGTNNTALLDIGNGNISCDEVIFENISRYEGNGTIFEFNPLSSSITLSGMTFNNCVCMNGSGGAISVTLTSSSYPLFIDTHVVFSIEVWRRNLY